MIDFVDCQFRHAELSPLEREKLYRWIYDLKPHNILEVGTGSGGSASYMAQALIDSGNCCKLYTCDIKRKPIPLFFHLYPFVRYYNITSDLLIKKFSKVNLGFIFFDGPDNPHIAINDLMTLEKVIKKGTYFSMHDWDYGKATRVRRYVQDSKRWEEIEVLGKNDDSVGLCLYKFLG